jgi:hypothetical protein
LWGSTTKYSCHTWPMHRRFFNSMVTVFISAWRKKIIRTYCTVHSILLYFLNVIGNGLLWTKQITFYNNEQWCFSRLSTVCFTKYIEHVRVYLR